MRNLTLSLDERILDESQEYARRQGKSLDEFVQDLLAKAIGQESGAAFSKMVAQAKASNARSEDGPLTRNEIYDRA